MYFMSIGLSNSKNNNSQEAAVAFASELLGRMALDEKLGQLNQVSGEGGTISPHLVNAIQEGRVSSIINEVDPATVNELQRIAIEESRLGIPLLIGRDVIHGFTTTFPIPLGQAATWCEKIVTKAARIGAIEASSQGVNWTFAPMIDITRDPRWGRIAESLGEDPFLCSRLGEAMVMGFQSTDLRHKTAIAACAKHFAGYGYSEGGRDYCFANISENELRNTVFPPFKALAEIGVATFMTSFSDLNGVPASGNQWLLQDVLRDEWQYKGFVVSDWNSIQGLQAHGLAENDEQCAQLSADAGVDMEMVSRCYANYLPKLIQQKSINEQQVDAMVLRILQTKFSLGLFENAYTQAHNFPALANPEHLAAAKEAAIKSCVLLKNRQAILPLNKHQLSNVAVIGPLANDGYEQLGTWIFDGHDKHSIDCLTAISAEVAATSNYAQTNSTDRPGNSAIKGGVKVHFAKGLATSRDANKSGFNEAINAAAKSDIAIMVMGEESILSGEAHCRSNIDLPGAQEALIEQISATDTPIVLVVMAGRPLTLSTIVDKVDAILYAWHPGSMGGEAISDLLFGNASPTGKLPVTFPRVVGQIPIYYAQKHGERPATEEQYVHQDNIPVRAQQTSLGMVSAHLDTHFTPLFPFGFGLNYSHFKYSNVTLSQHEMTANEAIIASVTISNNSDRSSEEIVQLYIRDKVASTTRPVKELKGFKRVLIKAHQSVEVSFEVNANLLCFYGPKNTLIIEKGEFHVWIGADSTVSDYACINLVD
ncbi:MAG: beta-glucosidase [Kangiellaceae bacterium]|jgi:beta-glucosidase